MSFSEGPAQQDASPNLDQPGFAGGRKAAIGLFLCLALILGMSLHFLGADWLTQIGKLDIWLLTILLGLSLINYALHAVRWRLLLLGHGAIASWRAAFLSYFAGLAMSATPGKVGELSRLWFLRRLSNVPYGRSLRALFGDRILDLVALLLLGCSGFGIASRHATSLIPIGGLIIILTLLWQRPAYLRGLLKSVFRVTGLFPRSIARARLALRAEDSLTVGAPCVRQLMVLLFTGLVGWLGEAVGFWMVISALGGSLRFSTAIAIFSVSLLLGAVSMLPGGVGTTEALMIGFLDSSGVGLQNAIIGTAITRVVTFWFAVSIGTAVVPLALRVAMQARRPI